MSLSTLLEAAEFLDDGTPTRDEKSPDFHPYAKTSRHSRKRKSSILNNNEANDEEMSEDGGEKRRAGGAGTREVHNKLEKNRRAHLKECFELLKEHIPSMEDKKISNLAILRSSLRYIQILKRKEKEFEQDMQRLAGEKIRYQENILTLKRDLQQLNIDFDLNSFVQAVADQERDTNSTSTASEGCSPIVSEDEDSGNLKRKTPSKSTPTFYTTGFSSSASGISKSVTSTALTTVTKTTASIGAVPVTSQQTVKTQVAQLLQRQISQRAQAQQQQQKQQQLPAIQPGPGPGPAVITLPNPGAPPHLTIPASSVRIPFHIQEVIAKAIAAGESVQVAASATGETVQVGPAATVEMVQVAPSATGETVHLAPSGTITKAPVTTSTALMTGTTTASAVPVQVPWQIKTEPGIQLPMQIQTNPRVQAPLQNKTESGLTNTASVVKPGPGVFTLVAHNPVKLESQPVTTQVSTVGTPVTMLSTAQVAGITSQAASNPTSTLKQILAPGTQILTPGNHLSAISQMVQQAIAQQQLQQQQQHSSIKTSPGSQTVAGTNQVIATLPQGLTSVSNMGNLTQFLAPITVMTPTMVQLNQNTSQPQLNNVQSFIKTVGGIPTLIQQPFLQGIQQVGGQVFKPVIMVTMPTVVAANVASPAVTSIPSSSAPSTVQLAVSVPRTTS
ncbi:max-binding protein MNT-like [Lineus longissimus]|uniref:max-binding protein MNT-like n=1 Tax=Lineus longissimus TaxID=88925 RepID=UPI002B4E77B3